MEFQQHLRPQQGEPPQLPAKIEEYKLEIRYLNSLRGQVLPQHRDDDYFPAKTFWVSGTPFAVPTQKHTSWLTNQPSAKSIKLNTHLSVLWASSDSNNPAHTHLPIPLLEILSYCGIEPQTMILLS
jgi:hypothetical protein